MTNIEYLEKYYNGDIEEAIQRLNNGEPVQYIVGNVNFYGNIIKVNKDVLIPRFETEELVSRTISYIKQYFNTKIDIVDIGTGSGCIAVTLKKEINCDMDAVDISNKAIEVAKNNAKLNNVDINFYLGNILEPLNKKYDVIISNPPYISHDEEIMDLVKNNEPHSALYADDNGLYFYKEILSKAHKYLKKQSIIAFEIGYMQGKKIMSIAEQYFPNSIIKLERDLQNKDRFIFIFNNIE